jgi:hypothetical protein
MIQIIIEMLQAYEDKLTSTMQEGSIHVGLCRLIMENYYAEKCSKRATLKKLRENMKSGYFMGNIAMICIAVVLADSYRWGK